MANASKKITGFAEDLADDSKELGKSKITAKEFGQAPSHGDHAKDYSAGVKMLDDSVKGFGKALTGFAGNIASGGKTYANNEQAQANAANTAGSQ
ncbi:hypothetical protein [Amycolatopsis anabasis]|uniref:hypothetical protein n=1 Tax=Amycolatopsis anabasis TaxID=1840409 RepID=UPI00131D5AE0|nr:hypothetical protein [Amycolatopsis anabasis]